ncbi:MAG TPA: hypothetical protein VH396_16110 [Chitinophagaceae bacterium]|jgi:hypothetical protein
MEELIKGKLNVNCYTTFIIIQAVQFVLNNQGNEKRRGENGMPGFNRKLETFNVNNSSIRFVVLGGQDLKQRKFSISPSLYLLSPI